MGMSYYDETTRRAADESAAHAGTVEQGGQWDRDDDEALSGSIWPSLSPDVKVGIVCLIGIAGFVVALMLGAKA